jgi:hypothetical protein
VHRGAGLRQTYAYRVEPVDLAGRHGPRSPVAQASTGSKLHFEVENLLPAAPGSVVAEAQGDCCGVHWSGGIQVLVRTTKPGDAATFGFTVPVDGVYDVSTVLTKAGDFGIHQLSIDGTPVGAPFDAYHPTVTTAPAALGRLRLSAGAHRLTLTATGKNAQSAGYLAGIDLLDLHLQ